MQGMGALLGQALVAAAFAVESFGAVALFVDATLLLFVGQSLLVAARIVAPRSVVVSIIVGVSIMVVASIIVDAAWLLVAADDTLGSLVALLAQRGVTCKPLLVQGLPTCRLLATLVGALALQPLRVAAFLGLALAVLTLVAQTLLLFALTTLVLELLLLGLAQCLLALRVFAHLCFWLGLIMTVLLLCSARLALWRLALHAFAFLRLQCLHLLASLLAAAGFVFAQFALGGATTLLRVCRDSRSQDHDSSQGQRPQCTRLGRELHGFCLRECQHLNWPACT